MHWVKHGAMNRNAKIAAGTVVALTTTAILGVTWFKTGGEAALSRYLVASLGNTARTARIDLAKSTVRLRLNNRNAIFDAIATDDEAMVVCGIALASFDPTSRSYFAYSARDENLVIGDNSRDFIRVNEMCETSRRK
jgi:hypothetical protein